MAEAKNVIRTIEEQVVVLTLTVDEARTLTRVIHRIDGSRHIEHIEGALVDATIGADYDIDVSGSISVSGEEL